MTEKRYLPLPDMVAWAEKLMASRPPDFVIGDAYLRRWHVIPPNSMANVYLHEINRSDDDRALHDHPWDNTSVLLKGRYIEHQPLDVRQVRYEGSVARRKASDLHRLEMFEGERAISLFLTGPKIREWGFACKHGWVHWRDFTNERDTGLVGRGCGEHGELSPTQIPGTQYRRHVRAGAPVTPLVERARPLSRQEE